MMKNTHMIREELMPYRKHAQQRDTRTQPHTRTMYSVLQKHTAIPCHNITQDRELTSGNGVIKRPQTKACGEAKKDASPRQA